LKQNKEYDFEKGATLLINKPLEWTSFDVVKKIRNLVRAKVGHSGTLDPLATGLLIICTGKFTKNLFNYQGLDKEYSGKMCLGATTASYDKESSVSEEYPLEGINDQLIIATAKKFVGKISQVPPKFSAIKLKGEPLYKLARAGKAPEPDPREVVIHEFTITDIQLPYVSFSVKCSKGTYIRSLVHDMGKGMNNGAYLSELCRTSIGDFQLKDAWELDDFITFIQANRSTNEHS